MSDAVDISDLPSPENDISDLPAPPVESTWTNAAKGVGQAALALGAGGLKAINLAANDILPETILGGPGSRAKMQQEISTDPILNYRGGPEAQPILSTLRPVGEFVSKIGSAVHEGIANVTSPRIADIVGDVATLAPGARGLFERGTPAIEKGHPLTEAAQSEAADLRAQATAAESQGLSLPGREVSAPQAYMDNAARRDLNLPKNAPVTSGLIDAAIQKTAVPAYDAARAVPDYQLGPGYKTAIGTIDLKKIDPEFRPPIEGTMSGQRAVELSQELRDRARGLFEDSENRNLLTSSERNAARAAAQAHYQAAKAVEGGFRESVTATGQQALADAWDAARPYVAKANSWRDALDGAGHVIGPKIRKLGLSDEPLSGPLKEAASVAAQYPELFRGTQLQTPKPGIIRKGIAAVAPVAGATAGGVAAGGTGALAGELAGREIGRRILNQ